MAGYLVMLLGGVLLGVFAVALEVNIFSAIALYSIGYVQMMISGVLK